MDFIEFQEKMDPAHRTYFCRMLKMKNLPECLLEQYLKVKKMVDIIDGSLAVGELAILALRAGYNPNTGKFLSYDETTSEGFPTAGGKVAVSKEKDYSQTFGKPLDESDDEVIEEAVEQPVEQTAEQAEHAAEQLVSGATGQAAEKPATEETAKLWSPGMPVRALHDEEFKLGKIVGISKPSEVGKEIGAAVQLTIEIEGEDTVTVEEKDVEAI